MQIRSYCFALIWIVLQTHAQELNWQWGSFQRNKGQLIDIMPAQKGAFSTIHATNQLGGGNNTLTQYDGLQALNSVRIKPVSPEGYGYYVQTLRQNNKHLVFIADRNGKEMKLFMKVLDAENNEIEFRELLSYTDTRPNALPDFNVIEAPNKAFFAVYYQIPGKRNGTDTYGYQLYNAQGETRNGGEYNLPFDANLSSIEDVFLTNNGEFFIGIIELEAIDNQGIRVRKSFKNLHVYQFNPDGLKDYTFDLEGKRISNFVMNSQLADRLTLFGIYSNSEWDGMQDGFFSVQLNLTADTAMAIGFLPFSPSIMLSEFRSNEQSRIQNRMDRRNEDPQLSRYQVRDIFTLPDGSYVGSLEKYYVYTSTNINNQTGQRMTTSYYHFDDIIAFCIDTSGHLKWEQRISKNQVSVNDYGPFSSYCSFTDQNSLNFIFNDAAANYDQDGKFRSNLEEVATFSLTRNRNVGAWVRIDLQTGSVERKVSHQRAEQNILLVPKTFEFDALNHQILTYGVLGPQEIYGYIELQTKP